MTEQHTRSTGQDDELTRLLSSYAASIPGPSAEASARMRTAVMAAAAGAAAPAAPWTIESPAAPTSAPRRRFGFLRWRPARLPLALAGAALAAALSVGAVAAAGPGTPLYGVRLWVEQVTLPSGGAARVDADLAAMQARLDEATAAASHGDGNAVSAALAAYRASVADALKAAGTDLTRLERLRIALERHVVVLQTLQARLPANAASAIGRTIQSAQQSIDELGQDISQNPGQGGKPSENPGQGPGGSGAPGQSIRPSSNPGQGPGGSGAPGQSNRPSSNPGQAQSPEPSRSLPPNQPSPKPSHSPTH